MQCVTEKQISSMLNLTSRAVQIRAKKERWSYVKKSTRGGSEKIYFIKLLPDDVKKVFELGGTSAASAAPLPLCLAPADIKESSEHLPAVVDQKPLTQKELNKADARTALLQKYLQYINRDDGRKKGDKKAAFIEAYNAKIIAPGLYEVLGKITSHTTIEGWKRRIKEKKSLLALADRRGAWKRGKTSVTDDEMGVMLKYALSLNRKLKSEIVRMGVSDMKHFGIGGHKSEATYRRALNGWIENHYDQWVLWRYGEKGLDDKCLPYAERDRKSVAVLEKWSADGKRLDFRIVDPLDGKERRMLLVMYHDFHSGAVLGWSIGREETTDVINDALRRSILFAGCLPEEVLIDNGAAFTSKHMTGGDGRLVGLYARLGIHLQLARAYNAKTKPIERLFETFGELSRMAPSYCGTDIAHRPPHHNRNEKFMKRLHQLVTGGKVPTINEAHRAISLWVDMYNRRKQTRNSGIAGKSPFELFEPHRGPGVDYGKLTMLMMRSDERVVSRTGIRFNGRLYRADELYGIRKKVTLRYDMQEPERVFVFDLQDNYICEATTRPKTHASVTRKGTDAEKEYYRHVMAGKARLKRQTMRTARDFAEAVVIPETRKQIEAAGFNVADNVTSLAKNKAEKKKPLTYKDHLQLEKEMAEMKKREAEMVGLSGKKQELEVYEPALIRECGEDCSLDALPEGERYERLLEMEARGEVISEKYSAFMYYFQMGDEYAKRRGEYEEKRVGFVYQYQRVKRSVS